MKPYQPRFRMTKIKPTFGPTVFTLVLGGSVLLAQPTFMRNMHTGPVVMPHTQPMTPVEGTIAVNNQRLRDRLESRDLPNPVPNTTETLEEGEWLYNVYCAVCHGITGQGNGQIADHFRRMPNLSAPHVQNYTDGWIYSIIGDGGFAMPPFASSMNEPERWALVHFVKTFTQPSGQ